MKNQARMTFQKSRRKTFFQRFRNEVKESDSIDKMRLSKINQSHYKIYNSQSPIQRSFASGHQSLQKMTSIPRVKYSLDESNRKTVKIKIKLLSSQQEKETAVKNTVRSQRSIEKEERRKHNQERLQNCQECSAQMQQSDKVAADIMATTQILMESTNQLKKHFLFKEETQQLQSILKHIASKINTLSQGSPQKKKDSATKDIISKESSLMKKLFDKDSMICEQKPDEQDSEVIKVEPQLDSLERSSDRPFVKSVSSFQIQNESTHWNQHLNIYEDSRNGLKSSSNRNNTPRAFLVNTSHGNLIQSHHNRVTSDTRFLKVPGKDSESSRGRKRDGAFRKQSQLIGVERHQERLDESGQNSSSTVEYENKRAVLNEVICLLNNKYNKKISFS